jgi:DNA-binding response OmpR family regulator
MKRKLRILIVEDEDDQAELMAMSLERANGFEVDYVRVDTEDAMIAALNSQPFDMVW